MERKKVKSMAREGADGKNKRRKITSEKGKEKNFTERSRGKDEVLKDEDGLKGDVAKSKRSNAVENAMVKSYLGGWGRIATRRNSARGERIVNKKAKGDTSTAKKSSSAIGVKSASGRNAANKKVMAEVENPETVRTPAKRSSSVDKKIAETIMLSLSTLRPRRGIPSFRKVDLSASGFVRVVGKRVKVLLSKWYTGKIESYDDKKKLHKVVYDDGDVQELDLEMQHFELEVVPDESYTLGSGNKVIVDGDLVNAGSSHMVSDAGPAKKYSKPTTKVATKAATNAGSGLLKSKDTAKRQRSSRLQKDEDISDGDMPISEIVKKVPLKVGDVEAVEKYSKQKRVANKSSRRKGLYISEEGKY